jgi:hypothetical protein
MVQHLSVDECCWRCEASWDAKPAKAMTDETVHVTTMIAIVVVVVVVEYILRSVACA